MSLASAPSTSAPSTSAPSTTAVVDLRGVTVSVPRRAQPVLREVDLHLRAGEDVVLLGPSGSGKSTLLDVVTGVVPHTVTATVTGQGWVAGEGLDTPVLARAAHVGVLGQDPFASVCLPHVDQEVALPLENHGVDPAMIGARVDDALRAVGAGHLGDRSTAALSGGESQRVALAAALVAEPAVLLLDEPTAMLDPAGIASVRAAVSAATARFRPAVVLVEHRLDEWVGEQGVDALPGQAVALRQDGTVLAAGPTRDVLLGHARDLLAGGCWLPLEAELAALTGHRSDDGPAAAAGRLARWAREQARHPGRTQAGPPSAHPAEPSGPPGPPVLTARGLAVGRGPGQVPVLAEVDLEVRPGEVVAVVGANGAGKSTLLLTLAGLLPPIGGTVRGPRPGMVFQNPEQQFVAHTVRTEIGHGLARGRGEDGTTAAAVADRLVRHRLEHVAQQSPYRLSGGEKRRLSLAAMLVHERPVLLADEPTFGLDRRDTVGTVQALREAAASGTAVVLASHDLRSVVALADRVVLLDAGRVVRDGPTAEVLRDEAALARAGIHLPPLPAWLLREHPDEAVALVRALDVAAAGLW